MNRPPQDLYAEFEDRLRFEMLLTELSAHFVSVTSESIDREIVEAQRRIVQALDLDRSTLAQVEGGERFVMTHTWHLPGLKPFPVFAVKDLPWMSSAMMRGEMVCFARIDDLPAEPIERVRVVVGRYRAAMLNHRDGGRLVAGTFTGTGNTFRVAEVIVDALLKAGYSEQEAARLCWALVYFTLGLTQEQQTSPPDADAAGVDFAEASYPALAKVGVQLLVHDSFDARFDYGLARLLNVA